MDDGEKNHAYQRAHAAGSSSLLRALRNRADEVQFGRALAVVCQDPPVARAFARLVVEHTGAGNAEARRRAANPPLDVTCVDERVLEVRPTRRGLARRAKDAGRVDLDFASTSAGWRLLVELKFDSTFGTEQLERYVERDAPVAAIVRDARKVHDLSGDPRWVGATSWGELAEGLAALPIAAPERESWRRLLGVMRDDGDFALAPPRDSPEAAAARRLLDELAPRLTDHFLSELQHVHGAEAETAVAHIRARRARGSEWAGLPIAATQDGVWVQIWLRNLWSRAPRLRVWYVSDGDWRARKRIGEAMETLSHQGWVRARSDACLYDHPMHALSNAGADAAFGAIAPRLTELCRSGIYSLDVRRQHRFSK